VSYEHEPAYYCGWTFPAKGEAVARVRYEDSAGAFHLVAVVGRGRDAELFGPRADASKRKMARLVLEAVADGPILDSAVQAMIDKRGTSLHRWTVPKVRRFLQAHVDQLDLLGMGAAKRSVSTG
jgi:hypothetical protein